MARLTGWILDHTRLVALGWLVIAMISLVTISSASNALSKSFKLPGQPGFETDQAIQHAYGNGGGNAPAVPVVTLPAGVTIYNPGVRAEWAAALARVQRAAPDTRIVSYLSTGNRLFVSRDGRTTFALVYLAAAPGTTDTGNDQGAVQDALASQRIAGTPIHVTGLDELQSSSGGGGNSTLVETLLGGIGALLVLALVFGSLLAAVPLIMALVAIPTSFLGVWGLTTITDVSSIVEYLISLLGLGIAIDYSLLIVLRWREERARGLENRAAVQRAMETAGRSVVFSGTTVAIGLLALVAVPVPFIRSVGLGGMLIPLVSVVVAVTLLPVVLATIGPRIDWPRHTRPAEYRFWMAWGRLMIRRRWLAAGVAVAALAVLLFPAMSMSVGAPSADALSRTGDAHAGLMALERTGIGSGVLTPFDVLVTGTNPRTVAARLASVPGVRGAVAPSGSAWHAGTTSLVVAVPAADGTSSSGRAALDGVRQAARTMPGSVRVGGPSAENADFLSAVYGNFPRMVALLGLITFLLLARAFRSLLLPLKAVGLVLVSVGASWGFMTFVWQDGHGSSQLWGIAATGSITAYIPIMVFAFLFGISMDYEVFLLSRMREEYDATGSTDAAVVRGIGSTGRLVTSAALILFLAFAALASGPDVSLKIIATGLAAGIILDATIIRMLLVPALVSLLGRWNWWMPAPVAHLLRVRATPVYLEPVDELSFERSA
ncbi:MAG TPA: MMPL family transporter [Chloroflexota bacterium]